MLAALFISVAHAQVGERLKSCATCHGADGNSVTQGVPSIAGQPKIFLENYLVMTREGIRGAGDMQVLMKGVSDRDIVELARHYSTLPARTEPGPVDQKLFRRGQGQQCCRHVRQ